MPINSKKVYLKIENNILFLDTAKQYMTLVFNDCFKEEGRSKNKKGIPKYIIKAENKLGIKKNKSAFETTISAIETLKMSLNIHQYYLTNYVEPDGIGVTVHNSQTHKKLILIGILNTCWMIREAVDTIRDNYFLGEWDKFLSTIDKSVLIKSRHKVASHNSRVFIDKKRKKISPYHLMEVGDECFSYASTGEFINVDEHKYKEELVRFDKITDRVIVKFFKRILEINRKDIINTSIKLLWVNKFKALLFLQFYGNDNDYISRIAKQAKRKSKKTNEKVTVIQEFNKHLHTQNFSINKANKAYSFDDGYGHLKEYPLKQIESIYKSSKPFMRELARLGIKP